MKRNLYRIEYDCIPLYSKVIIYGIGRIGVSFIKSINRTKKLKIVAVVDKYQVDKECENFIVENPNNILNYDYDYILLTVESERNANDIKGYLVELGIDKEKIIWNDREVIDSELIKCEFEFEKFLFRNIANNKKNIYLFMVPEHGNVGDYAIAYSVLDFLEYYFPEYKVFTVTATEWLCAKSAFVSIISPDDIIMFNGGGYLGDIWEGDIRLYKDIISTFENNKIVFFPNTIGFLPGADAKDKIKREMNWLAKRSNVHIMFREQKSYDILKEYSERCRLYPDMVLFQGKRNVLNYNKRISNTGKSVLLCLRNDREALADIKESVILDLKKANISYDFLEINAEMYMPFEDGKIYIKKVCEQMMKYDCVVTDRLHGMLLAVLSNVPCIAFDNITNKVSGVYNWIKDAKGLYLCDKNMNCNLKDIIEKVICDKLQSRYFEFSLEKFDDMADYIKKIIED